MLMSTDITQKRSALQFLIFRTVDLVLVTIHLVDLVSNVIYI